MPGLKLALGVVLALAGCTDSRLYGEGRGAALADRLTLSGHVCAEDPRVAELPLRVVFMLDQSMAVRAFDPTGLRTEHLQTLATRAILDRDAEVSVAAFGARPLKIAPPEPDVAFTSNVPQIEAAISGAELTSACVSGRCRDPVEALRSARALIEDDMAATPAGLRIVSEYAIILLTAGLEDPLPDDVDCCPPDDAMCLGMTPMPSGACAQQRLLAEANALRTSIALGGALGLKVHVLHLAVDTDPFVNDLATSAYRALVGITSGTYTRFDAPGAINPAALNVLGDRASLDVKMLTVSNVNARPGPNGPRPDSDADGFSDEEEEVAGTSPIDADSDDDGITDLVETLIEFDPLVADDPTACIRLTSRDRDTDLDGLTDCDEALIGTERTLVDSDGDGLPDSIEVFGFTEYLADDAAHDADEDGATNGEELRTHTDARSTDTRNHLSDAYRYEIIDEGQVTESRAELLDQLFTVEVTFLSKGTTPGLAEIAYDASTRTLAYRDTADPALGEPVPIPMLEEQEIELRSSSYAPVQGEMARFIRVRIFDLDELPDENVTEVLRIGSQTRRCLQYTVRNVRLVDTLETEPRFGPGLNRIVLFFGETPARRLDAPGPFRLVEIPVVFRPPSRRTPSNAVLTVTDDEFLLPDVSSVDVDEVEL